VVPYQRVDRSTGLPGPTLESEQEVEHLLFFIAASDEVAELDDGQRAADPLVASINGTRRSEREAQRAEIRVDVTDGDNATAAN
jgi:hypothetical protein